MKTEAKNLLAEVAEQLKVLWIFDKEPVLRATWNELFVAYTAGLLNPTRRTAEVLNNLHELRDMVDRGLKRHGWTVVKVGRRWVSKIWNAETQKVIA